MPCLLGGSGPLPRLLVLASASLVAVLAAPPLVAALLAVLAVAVTAVAPRRLPWLAGGSLLAFALYAAILHVTGAGGLRVALEAAGRVATPLAAAAWVTAETPPASWLSLPVGRRARAALAATLATLPVLARDLGSLADAARTRGYGRLEGAVAAVPAGFVRALRRGRVMDEALAQAGHPGAASPSYRRHQWNGHDTLVTTFAILVAGVAFL